MSRKIRTRRENLWKQDPHCYWCGCLTVPPPKRRKNKVFVDNEATLDHLRTRFNSSRQEPNHSNEQRTVLACRKCNGLRGKQSEKLAAKKIQEIKTGLPPEGI